MKKSLKLFNPGQVGKLEAKMWKAYYDRHFFKLFVLLVNLLRQQFGLNYYNSFRAAYYSSRAAMDFRRTRGQENIQRILITLTKFYKIISDSSSDPFDYKKAAQSEIEWWLVDRYPEKYSISRMGALKNNMAAIYNVERDKLENYARYRAEAMVVHDNTKAHRADWQQIEALLINSYKSLSSVIQ